MRFRVTVALKKKGIIIPYDHQYFLYSYILRTIERVNPSYSFELHRPRKYKHHTFSYLMAKNRKSERNGVKVLDDHVYFFISSPDVEFLKTLVEGMLSHPEFRIRDVKGYISEVRILKEPEFRGKMAVKTLTPIVIKKAEKPVIKDGKKKIVWRELYPNDAEFASRLVENLKKRFADYFGRNADKKDLKIKVLEFKPKRHNIAGTYHRGSLCKMIVEGDKDLIKYGYDAGFGEKNAMGFGMVRVAGGGE